MENISNNSIAFNSNLINNKNDSSKNEFRSLNEEHTLSLRKKRNNKHTYQLKNLNLAQNILNHNININQIINLIENQEIYIKYKSSENEYEKLNYIMQMMIFNNNNILKYALVELKQYLIKIKDKDEFSSKNLLNYFNEKMFKFLIELLIKNKNTYINLEEYYQIKTILCHIISNLCILNDFYINSLLEYFQDILTFLIHEQDNIFKNEIYTMIIKILLTQNKKENETDKLEQNYKYFSNLVIDEIINLNKESNTISNLKILFPTLLSFISAIIYNNIRINKNFIFDIKKLLYILSFINKYLSTSFMETNIMKSALNFLSAFTNFYKANKINFDKENDEEFRKLMNNIEIDKHIILFIYDNSINDFELRIEIIELMNNLLTINNSEFAIKLIDNGISEQISNIQDYLLENENSCSLDEKNMKLLYSLHIDLIDNLISTQSEYIIQDICIEHSCISNLFQLINNSKFCFNNDNLKIMEIFDLIIKSKTDFVHSLLLTEGIYDLYKNILFNCNHYNLLELILNDIAIMIERGKSIKTSSGINIVSNHFIKNGIYDLIDNIKSRMDFNEKINYLLEEISNLLKEKSS
jgi:hypothetical protein